MRSGWNETAGVAADRPPFDMPGTTVRLGFRPPPERTLGSGAEPALGRLLSLAAHSAQFGWDGWRPVWLTRIASNDSGLAGRGQTFGSPDFWSAGRRFSRIPSGCGVEGLFCGQTVSSWFGTAIAFKGMWAGWSPCSNRSGGRPISQSRPEETCRTESTSGASPSGGRDRPVAGPGGVSLSSARSGRAGASQESACEPDGSGVLLACPVVRQRVPAKVRMLGLILSGAPNGCRLRGMFGKASKPMYATARPTRHASRDGQQCIAQPALPGWVQRTNTNRSEAISHRRMPRRSHWASMH